jgi:hypothetical protein
MKNSLNCRIKKKLYMKRFTLIICALLAIGSSALAQCGGKGLKAIDAKDYATAWTSLDECLKADPDDISAHFGLSRLHGIQEAGKKDKALALDHLRQATAGWDKLDEKGRAKFEKMGITTASLEERRDRIESTFLEAAKAENTVAAYDEFLITFPNSKSANTCRNYRNDLAYKLATDAGTVDALDEYIMAYPDAENIIDVTKARDLLASTEALKTGTEASLTHFLQRYPTALQAPQVQQRLNAVAFDNAKAANTVEAFKNYIARFPDAVFITQAREKLEWLEAQQQK